MVKMHHPLAQVRGHCPKALRANGTSRREASRCLSLQGLYAGVRGFRVPVTHYTLACCTGTRYRACTPAYAYGEFWEPEYPGMPVWLRQRMVNYGNPNTSGTPAYGCASVW